MSDFLKAVLPTEIVAPTLTAPRTILAYSDYKAGKTTIASVVSQQYRALLLDYEDGSEAQASYRINIRKAVKTLNEKVDAAARAKGLEKAPDNQRWGLVSFLKKLAADLAAADPKPYDFIFHDKVDTLEDWCEKWATASYKASVIGTSFKGDSVLELPEGGGYRYLRAKFEEIWNALIEAAPHHIFFCSQRMNKTAGAETDFLARDLDLTGKVRKIAAGQADAPAHLYVKEDESRWISFKTADKLAFVGNRFAHLEGKEFKLSWKGPDGKIIVDWKQIFPNAKERNGAI